jgi:ribose transport system substrate-binding protein
MKRKRLIIDITVITLMFFLFIIWHQNSMKEKAMVFSNNIAHNKVYLITTDKEYQYWDIVNKGASDMATLVGIKYVWDAPDERNAMKQIEIINKAVETGADAILIAADDPRLISGAVEDAKARGVKIIYVDSPAYEEAITTLATDNYEAGVHAAETLLSIFESRGIEGGSVGIVSLPQKANVELRERGFRNTMASDPRFQVLDSTIVPSGTPEDAKTATIELMETNDELVAIFGTNEGASEGLGYANKEKQNQYIAIGFDETTAMMKLLRNGSLDAIVVQNPYTMGYLGMAQAIAAILGKNTGPEYLNTGVKVMTIQ